ncbi:MAG: ACT domain-containing protein [Gammaproteobacteria bacterium]|nr:ACT domain-containing protein [Gammaproteobacteria bacterium]
MTILLLPMNDTVFPLLHLQTEHTIAKLKHVVELPSKSAQLYSLTVTAAEITLIAPSQFVNQHRAHVINREDNWHVIKFDTTFNFSAVGVLARVAQVLAEHEVSILALSTFATDYILVKQQQIGRALIQLRQLGHNVTSVHQLA